VAENGDLANWSIPGKFSPGAGGAVELAQKSRKVGVIMTHVDKYGQPKIKKQCSLPLTACGCVDRIYTDLAVIDVNERGLELIALRDEVSPDEVFEATEASLHYDATNLERF
ncbi:unnamed protein product, partial [Cyprideis torosa]